jgi:predicted MFS family arabinose efflux permease
MSKKRTAITVSMVVALVLALSAIAVIFENFNYVFDDNPFVKEHPFDSPSGVFAGNAGRTYIIDEGKKKVLVLNKDKELEFVINGGSKDDDFFYASQITDDENGNIYIADANYLGTGTIVESERIIRFNAKGKEPQIVYEEKYNAKNAPKQYGRIKHIEVSNGDMLLASADKSVITVTRYNLKSKEKTTTTYDSAGTNLSDVTVYGNNKIPVYITRTGQIGSFDKENKPYLINENAGTAWQLAVTGNDIYYTELLSGAVMKMDFNGNTSEFFSGDETILSTLDSKNGVLVSTDNLGCYYVSSGDEAGSFSAPFRSSIARFAAYFLLLIAAVCALWLLICLIIFIAKKMHSETAQRILIVIIASICVTATVSYTTLSTLIEIQNNTVMKELNLFGDMLIKKIDVEKMKAIDDISDYQKEEYTAVKSTLDAMVDMAYKNGSYYYYGIYVADEDIVYAALDYEDTVTTRHPFYPNDPDDNGYAYVLYSGEEAEVSADVSSFGSWSFVLKPIFDADGNVVSLLEVGVNLDEQMQTQRALTWEVILTVFSVTAVLVMTVIEVIFFLKFRGEKQARARVSAPGYLLYPLRTLTFIAFLADCMQDAFVSILANTLYTPVFGIPQSVGAAIPLSAQVLTAALLALAGGSIAGRIGVKKTLIAGFILQSGGFVGCAVFGTYAGLLIGKAVIGAGIGLIIVSLNTVAAANSNVAESANSFSGISAGTLVGVSVGSGIGSIILAWASYDAVYYVGAAILLLGLILAITCPEFKVRTTKSKDKPSISFGKFITNKKAVSFLLFVLLPFMVAISFREYLFPIYAEDMGITESNIGRIYLLFGIFIIYAGPVITKALIERFSTKTAIIVSNCIMLSGILLFAFVQSKATAVIGVFLLSVATSFGYAVQSTHYSTTPAVGEYGESKAMGIYSLFDNGGQTLGPVVYGLALLLGYRDGLIAIGCGLLTLTLLFLILNIEKMKRKEN